MRLMSSVPQQLREGKKASEEELYLIRRQKWAEITHTPGGPRQPPSAFPSLSFACLCLSLHSPNSPIRIPIPAIVVPPLLSIWWLFLMLPPAHKSIQMQLKAEEGGKGSGRRQEAGGRRQMRKAGGRGSSSNVGVRLLLLSLVQRVFPQPLATN